MGTGITLNVIITRKLITYFFVLLNYTIYNFVFQVLFDIFYIFLYFIQYTEKYIDEILVLGSVPMLFICMQNYFVLLHKLSVTHFRSNS